MTNPEMNFENAWGNQARAEAYSRLEFPNTYYLAYRDLPEIISQHITGTYAVDFGCGTGLVTLQLAPFLRSMTGVDSSPGMLDRLNRKIIHAGFSNVRTELCDVTSGDLPMGLYHLITSAMTLHHMEEVAPLLQALKRLLHPGGWVSLADLASEDGSFHDDPTGIFHHGFSADELSDMLRNAGFSSISISRAADIKKGDKIYPVLLATAQSE